MLPQRVLTGTCRGAGDGRRLTSQIKRAAATWAPSCAGATRACSHATATWSENQQLMRDLHPALPQGSVLPGLPQHAPEMMLEDDAVMHALLRGSNNGSASGPSGWGGNMLSSLVESDSCRAGIITPLKDIINGNLPDSARQQLLTSRAIGLGKPDNGIRPIAIGELFYRLASRGGKSP